jgi:hypothetical protein
MADNHIVNTRSSGRTRKAPNTFTPTKNSDTHVNYALNRKKAIKKKVDASDRIFDMEIVDKSGTLVMTFSAAAYEIFRHELLTYLVNKSNEKVEHTSKYSADGNKVEDSFGVYEKTSSTLLYRINLFHTTSRADVNGKKYMMFVTDDLPNIQSKLETYSDLTLLNKKLKSWCQNYLQPPKNDNSSCSVAVSTHIDLTDLAKQTAEEKDTFQNQPVQCIAKMNTTSVKPATPPGKHKYTNITDVVVIDSTNSRSDGDITFSTIDTVSRSDCFVTHDIVQNSNLITTSQCNITPNISLATVNALRTPITSTTQSSSNVQDKSSSSKVKSSDVRAREDKLRKKEDELAIREAALREKELRHIHLETYIEKLEARNTELDKSLRLLKRRLAAHESQDSDIAYATQKSDTDQPCAQSQQRNNQNELVQKIHERVTNFVLTKIDRELDDLLQSQSTPGPVNNTSDPYRVPNTMYTRSTANNIPHSEFNEATHSDTWNMNETIKTSVHHHEHCMSLPPNIETVNHLTHSVPQVQCREEQYFRKPQQETNRHCISPSASNSIHKELSGVTRSDTQNIYPSANITTQDRIPMSSNMDPLNQSMHLQPHMQRLVGQPVFYQQQPFLENPRPSRLHQ